MFEEVLGYDPLGDITRECPIDNLYVDIALKVDGAMRLLVEVKSAGTQLRDHHIKQALLYAAKANVPWVVLTSGVVWNLYHLSFDEGIEDVKAFSVDLGSESLDIDTVADQLALLHRHSLAKGELDDWWRQQSALGPESIARAIFTEDTMKLIKRDIHHRENILIDEEDLAQKIYEMFSAEMQKVIGSSKIKHKCKTKAHVLNGT